MKKMFLALAVLALSMIAAPAQASPISVQLVGTPGPVVGGVYVAPYELSLNGGPAIGAICDTYANEISQGETWSAVVNPFQANGGVTGLFGSSDAKYDEAAQLYGAFLAGKANAAGTNYAIWALFDPSVYLTAGFESTDAATLLADYHPQVGFDYANYDLITPIPGTQSSGGTAQEFIVDAVTSSTPEPGSLVLFGTGMLSLAGILRRKLLA